VSDLVERLRVMSPTDVMMHRDEIADRIEELERYEELYKEWRSTGVQQMARIEELERFAGFALDERNTAFAIREQARAVLEKGKP
jgi:hypothetical protein